ncbi:MAG: hypothetical protein AB2552_22365 [Candidatus Thiodiazotropha endolucinida]
MNYRSLPGILLLSIFLIGCEANILYHQRSSGLIRINKCDNLRTIALPTSYNRFPQWSPEASHFAYYGEEASGPSIFVSDRIGGSVRNLTPLVGTPTMDYIWGKDSRWLYFTWQNENGLLSIYRVDTLDPTSSPILLTPLSLNSKNPDISADNRQLVYASMAPGDVDNYDIYSANTNGTNRTRLIHTPAVNDILPAWGPDGRVAYVSDRNIVLRSTAGTSQTIGRPYAGRAASVLRSAPDRLAWSEDGATLAYNGGGGKITTTTTTPPFDTDCISCSPSVGLHLDEYPHWYDDDQRIVFSRPVGDLVNPDYREQGVVTIARDGSDQEYIETGGEGPDPRPRNSLCF